MVDELIRGKFIDNRDNIKKLLEKDEDFIESLTSENLYRLVMYFANDDEIKSLITKHVDKILYRCTVDYDMYNCFTIIGMKVTKIEAQKAEDYLSKTIKKVFCQDSIIYLLKLMNYMKKNGIVSKEALFELIINDLKAMPTNKSSKILFDLYIFPDFKLLLNTHYRITATLIEAYQLYDSEIISSHIINGSTIIGKLIDKKNEAIVAKYLRDLLQEKQISTRNIKMVGGGGSCLVFKINDMVIKLGEERNDKKIFINHRILASFLRKLELDANGDELFYVEIMKYALTGDVTPAERDELKRDLYDQGLIWDDDKLANCGVLVEGDDNYYDRPIDYSVFQAHIDNPVRREEFNQRRRRVVVIDNDHIRYNTAKSCR